MEALSVKYAQLIVYLFITSPVDITQKSLGIFLMEISSFTKFWFNTAIRKVLEIFLKKMSNEFLAETLKILTNAQPFIVDPHKKMLSFSSKTD